MSDQHNQTRRQLIKGLGITGVAMAAAPALAASPSAEQGFDREYDIIIIGSGFAGLAAGIEAKRKGFKKVVILEKMPTIGGNSAINGGLFAAPNTEMQRRDGVTDSVEAMVQDQLAAGRGIADETLLRHVAEHANEALELCIEAGAEFHPYLQQLGGHSVPRTYQTSVSCGAGITQPLLKLARKEGVEVITRANFLNFVTDAKGGVAGIEVEHGYYYERKLAEGKRERLKAGKGVIVATGGFAQNVPLRQSQDPTLTDEIGSTNMKGATGEAMLQMFRLGGVPVHLAHIQSGPWASPDEGGFGYVSNYCIFNFPHSMAVNRATGRRFMNEIADRKTRADAIIENRDAQGEAQPPLLITSYEQANKHPNCAKVLRYNVGWKFDTLEELADHFGTPKDALKAQLAEYNGYIEAGEDKQFGKIIADSNRIKVEAPFMVVRLWPKVHYCQGGVQITPDAEVIDSLTGAPIPGLFAAGEVAGGIHGVSRLGSCSIPECMVMGMTAARTLASRKA
ncbi:flavocytochrome c [Ferrimonas marina]|uniref:Flavocytochrome c n=1 Tax=Ferrimonas marina TaxID=299255 RepID=A0A1M5X9E6_9GAMM|nr:flavocytochrome c [Ferrimonas marina]SHH96178.1 flavocytochrome c [Ferrimonas marina]